MEYEGIAGAVLGTVATLVTTHLLRYRGAAYAYATDWQLTLYDRSGGSLNGTEYLTTYTKFGSVDVTIDLYNSAEVATGLRDIQLEIAVAGDVTKIKPRVKTEGDFRSLRVINLPSRIMQSIDLRIRIERDTLEKLTERTEVYLSAKDYKDKPFRQRIYVIEPLCLPTVIAE